MNLLRPLDLHLRVNGLRLHVLDGGGGDRTPLLLLHGFAGHAPAWDTLSIALQPHFHVYALDARGHGDSDPADTYNAIAAFDDISGVVDQLGLRALVLVGLSMGGRNARSEEHTSELQSQSNIVCRLLLEKKKPTHCRRPSAAPPPQA